MKEVRRLLRLFFISLRISVLSFVDNEMIRKPGPDSFEIMALSRPGKYPEFWELADLLIASVTPKQRACCNRNAISREFSKAFLCRVSASHRCVSHPYKDLLIPDLSSMICCCPITNISKASSQRAIISDEPGSILCFGDSSKAGLYRKQSFCKTSGSCIHVEDLEIYPNDVVRDKLLTLKRQGQRHENTIIV